MAALVSIVDYIAYSVIHSSEFSEKLEHMWQGCVQLKEIVSGDEVRARYELAEIKIAVLKGKTVGEAQFVMERLAEQCGSKKGSKGKAVKMMQVTLCQYLHSHS